MDGIWTGFRWYIHCIYRTIPCLPFRLWPSRCQKHQGSKGRHNESMCVSVWCGESWTLTVKPSAHSEFWIANCTGPTITSTKKPKAVVAFRASAKAKGVDALACIQALRKRYYDTHTRWFDAVLCNYVHSFACSNHSSYIYRKDNRTRKRNILKPEHTI